MKEEVMKVATLPGISWEDGQESTVRLLKQVRETGEDLLYELKRHVRRNPWKAVAVALAAGVILGLAVAPRR
jgi:ElaB/YqjD/DUF883 family membrane-anchored ribosome-binding protein